MTRARQTLTLARLDIGNPLVDRLSDSPALLRRPASEWLPEPPGLDRRYVIPSLREIDLGFAGRKKFGERIHARIAALKVGDVLLLSTDQRGYALLTPDGIAIGHLSQNFKPPTELRCITARVHASSSGASATAAPNTPTAASASAGRWWCRNWFLADESGYCLPLLR